jgi:hypothetical protein
MRKFLLSLTVVVAFALLSGQAGARTRIIAVADDLDDRSAAFAHIALNSAFALAAPNDTILIYDATTRLLIDRIAVAGPGIANPTVRKRMLGGAIDHAHDFIDERAKAASSTPIRSNLNIPEFMAQVGDTIVTATSEPIDMLLIGAARSFDPREPSFGFVEGRFPSDGHIGAQHDKTPWSTQGRESSLRGVNVHLCFVEPDTAWVNPYHRKMTGRFYALWLGAQSARLATFLRRYEELRRPLRPRSDR